MTAILARLKLAMTVQTVFTLVGAYLDLSFHAVKSCIAGIRTLCAESVYTDNIRCITQVPLIRTGPEHRHPHFFAIGLCDHRIKFDFHKRVIICLGRFERHLGDTIGLNFHCPGRLSNHR